MKKLISLLCITFIFCLNLSITYAGGPGELDKKSQEKFDLILNKFFNKVEKKINIEQAIIYNNIYNKINSLVYNSTNKQERILNYLSEKITPKLIETSISTYNTSGLNYDINFRIKSDELYENSMQHTSKDEKFDKNTFIKFYEGLGNGDIEKSKNIFVDGEFFYSPFYPTCCSFKVYKTAEIYKNGIIGIYVAGNGDSDYNFYYMTKYGNYLIELKTNSKFSKYGNGAVYNSDIILENTGVDEIHQYMIDFLINKKSTNDNLKKQLEIFKNKIDNLYNNS